MAGLIGWLAADDEPTRAVNAQWPGNVLQALLANVDKLSLDFSVHLAVGVLGDADAAGLGHCLQPRRYIHPVSEDVVALGNYVAQVDPHAELDPLVLRDGVVALDQPLLDLDGTADGIHHARELGQEAVARVLDDPAPMLRDLRIDQFPEVALEPFVRPLLIHAHQPRIARHIGGKDRG